ncbi:MAG: heme-copper oxidase subunit III [Acidobacteria bacterium]|nr:heme-copper oxidase subunit III [Acidobacteriota bacterium]
MAGKTATEELELTEVGGDDGAGLMGGAWGPDGGNGDAAATPQGLYLTGIWIALASILMFFAALTSAFVVRLGIGNDWVGFELPRLLWGNTAVLLASSATIERARRVLGREWMRAFRYWWAITTGLGLLFLAGQFVVWHQLADAGVYLATNPSSSFFYLLTGSHGLHLLGGVMALAYVGWRERRPEAWRTQKEVVTAASIYWHFLGGLWIFLFVLLQLGR